MTFITFFQNENGFLATDQRVFSAEELTPFTNAIDHARHMEQELSEQARKAADLYDAAKRDGYEQGLLEGGADAKLQLVDELLNLREQHAQAVSHIKDSCAQLATDIVRKIAGNIRDEEWLLAQAEQAADDVVDDLSIKLRVHSSKVDAVRSLLARSHDSPIQSVIADDSLADKVCVIDTGAGQIDVSLDTQLGSILRIFDNADGHGGGSHV